MSSQKPIFLRPLGEYTRDFNFVSQYMDQCVTYAKLQDPNIDTVAYRQWMNEQVKPDGLFPLKDRRMKIIMKDENNDRQKNIITVSQYFKQVSNNGLRFAPTFTTYRGEEKQKSLESAFLVVGMANRSKEKKLKFQAKERGDEVMVEYHDGMQGMLKVLNNSSSGAKATKGTILYNQTGHSTLTSICRSETSFANSTNEKFLGGFRHYFNIDTVINNILAVLTYCDEEQTRQVMEKYQLKYITNDELLWAIKRSTELYWHAPTMFAKIEEFVNKLSPLQCSMYLYNSDLFMLRQFNEPFVRDWFDKLLSYGKLTHLLLEEAEQWIGVMDGDLAALVAVYASHLCNGKSVKTVLQERPETKPEIGAIIKNTLMTFEYYRDLIECFWVTDIMPFETAHVPHMMRGIVLGSDTDSSLFAVDLHWVKWYCGEIIHDRTSMDVEATAVYMTSMHIAHILGMMTGILNVLESKRHIFAMKNEFMFSSFTTTSRGKHYFAKKDAQEGIMINRDKFEAEIKGVGLKHTKVPAHITKGFHKELESVMNQIQADEKISILERTKTIATLENNIFNSIKRGEPTYLQRGQIKVKDAYKDENSLYKRGYELWEAVFAPKYGHTTEPPYDAIKIAIRTDTKARFKAWLDTFEDKALANRLQTWVDENLEGRPLKTFYVPQAVAASSGLPAEFMSVMEPRKLVYTMVAPYYLLTESMGSFLQNKKITRLYSDDFPGMEIPDTLLDLGDDNDDSDDGDDE